MRSQEVSTPEDELLTVEEVATILKVPVATMRKWRNNGEGPDGFRVGKYVRYRRSSVDRFITEQERRQRESSDLI